MSESLSSYLATVVSGLLILLVYFLPSFVARQRRHLRGGTIFLLNLCLGWSGIVWVITLIWASIGKGFANQKMCVFCKEWIPRDAVVCSHCARDQHAEALRAPKLTVPCRFCKTEISASDDICYSCKRQQSDPLELRTGDL